MPVMMSVSMLSVCICVAKSRMVARSMSVVTLSAIVVTVFAIISFVIGYYLMLWVFRIFTLLMNGYFAFYMKPLSMVLSVVYLLLGYAFVSVIDFLRIKKIPLDVALKNVE